MFPQKNPLPRAEGEPSTDHGDRLARTGQRHLNVARHVIRTFGSVGVTRSIGNEFVHVPLEISTGRRVGILHQHQATAGVTAKNKRQCLTGTRALYRVLDAVSNFIEPPPSSIDRERKVRDRHDSGRKGIEKEDLGLNDLTCLQGLSRYPDPLDLAAGEADANPL